MRGKSRGFTQILVISSVTFFSLILLWLLPSVDRKITPDKLYYWLDSLGCIEKVGDARFIEEQAYRLAVDLFDDPARRQEFADELLKIYLASCGKDFLLVYNTGGFGGTTLASDPEWGSVLNGIQSELAKLGYTSQVVEHRRGEYSLAGCLKEAEDFTNSYSLRAPKLAAKIAFLIKYEPNLKVIITGRSSGTVFSSEVMKFLEADSQVYSIQVGCPFWYTEPISKRTLAIDDNGVIPDALSRGNLLAIIRANLSCYPSPTRPEGGSMKIGPYFFRVPGHEYTWDYPGVRSQVTVFVKENFGDSMQSSVEEVW
jgi:hypothetical protein